MDPGLLLMAATVALAVFLVAVVGVYMLVYNVKRATTPGPAPNTGAP